MSDEKAPRPYGAPTRHIRQLRIEQIQIAFPAVTERERRWWFSDGTKSAWNPASRGIEAAPPAAYACEWRERGIEQDQGGEVLRLARGIKSRIWPKLVR